MSPEQPAEISELRMALAERERQLDAVRRMAVGLCTATGLEELLKEALQTCLRVAEAEAGSIVLYDHDPEKPTFQYVIGEKAEKLSGLVLDPHSRQDGVASADMVTVPLKSRSGVVIGQMQAINKIGSPFDQADLRLIETMALQVALAIETARLNEQARLATVIRFIGNISHDVKNMVTPAMTGAQTLNYVSGDCFRTFDQAVDRLAESGTEVNDLQAALSDLRELYPELTEMIAASCEVVQERVAEIAAAVKGMVSKPIFESSDVIAIARRVGTMLAMHAQKKGVTVTVESDIDVHCAEVDAKQIYNAIYNLTFNAIDACEEGDRVTLRVSTRDDGEFPNGGCVVFECSDTGPGIPDEVRAKLFTDEAITTKPMGTGLGTRIVKNVVDAHGGLIELETEVGVGTTVRCLIPSVHG